ncbi:MAG TPA: transglutaminaseTgpA domain-containing protein, partial [Yinghuangia sp.]|nr:transglutaminaseTgpA domain-containing protein [Yinghuangia sp.]
MSARPATAVKGRSRPASRASAPALAFVLALAAGLAFHRAHGLRAVAPVVAIAAAAPVVVSALLSRSHRNSPAPLWRSLLAQPVAWFLVAWGILYRDAVPSAELGRRMGMDLLDAPHRVLTTVAPVPAEGALLVLPFTAVWLAAYAGAELALRTRTVLTPALPAFAVFALAVVTGAGGPGSNVAPAGGFACAIGALVIVRAGAANEPTDGRHPRPFRLGALASSVPLVVCCALLAALFAPALSGVGGRTPLSPRDEAAAPAPAPLAGANPLALVGSWLADPLRPMFRVQTTADSVEEAERLADQDWRLAVFTDFDGRTWSPAPSLQPTGGRIPDDTERRPAGPDSGVRTVALDQRITVQRLGGVWLPSADRPSRIEAPADVDDLAVDPDSGALATRVPLRDGDTYRVESHVPVFDPRRIQFSRPADDPAMTRMPDSEIRDRLRELAQQATAGSEFPYQQALRLAQWLRDNHVFDVSAVPGHTYRALEFFLTESKRGTSEQFATAFAAMARTLGLPTRVAVGFHRGTEEADGWQVFGRDAVVWPEVE